MNTYTAVRPGQAAEEIADDQQDVDNRSDIAEAGVTSWADIEWDQEACEAAMDWAEAPADMQALAALLNGPA